MTSDLQSAGGSGTALAESAVSTRAALAEARRQTDKLFELLQPGALSERPIAERHRIIFYLGHLEAFDWNLLREGMGAAAFDAKFDRLFAFGIDPVDGGLPSEPASAWPPESEIRAYNHRVREAVDAADHDPWLLRMALEHRLMHAETLAYMLQQLPLDLKRVETQADAPPAGPVRNQMVEIPGGEATLGLERGDFGWDNEFDAHGARAAAFAMDRYKVSNGAYLEFVKDGGYEKPELWRPEAWTWIRQHGISHPVFWLRSEGEWLWRGMFDEVPLPLDWPVYVSHAEASAYAKWAGKRLPAEAEWHRAAYGTAGGEERAYPWGSQAPSAQHGYFDFERWDPLPVNAFPESRSAFGVEGLMGNGWEWTASEFAPFQGFQAHPLYKGYSADFFDGRHFVMKGGSTRTAGRMLRRSFRNWFQPHYQYVYAGFRCVNA